MKSFKLVRDVDVTGISGTGTVAEGREFRDGRVALRWRGDKASVILHDSLANVEAIHCHGGATRIEEIYDLLLVIQVGGVWEGVVFSDGTVVIWSPGGWAVYESLDGGINELAGT